MKYQLSTKKKVFVLHSCHSCRTCIARVWHSCCKLDQIKNSYFLLIIFD